MEISVHNRPQAAVVTVSGDMVADFDGALAQAVTTQLDGGATRIVIDLGGVPYVNSAGLSALVTVSATANTRGGRVVLVGLSAFFEQVLATTRLNKFFEVHKTVEDACAA